MPENSSCSSASTCSRESCEGCPSKAKGGSGIDLSIVKKILEDHGGKVWATSRLGIGTIMYFVLRKYQEVPMK